MRYRFLTADVFTDRIFGGNQLAVLPDASGLTGEQMQLVAREFNYSETVFVLPPESGGNTRRLRIFGAAAAAFGGYLAARDATREGTVRWVVEQGFEMGRPSILEIEVDKREGEIAGVRVGGATVLVSEGEIEVP